MLSASLPTVDAYHAVSLSPITVVARVLASQLTSPSRIPSATASAGKANHRNGYSKKTVLTETSKIDIKIMRFNFTITEGFTRRWDISVRWPSRKNGSPIKKGSPRNRSAKGGR